MTDTRPALERVLAGLGCTGPALLVVIGLSVANVVLVNFHRTLFGAWWRHVMWEGGVLELATAAQFLAAAVVFGVAAAARPRRSPRRRWLLLFAVTNLVLLGEETNYFQGMVILDLDHPDFATRYNPQAGNLHNLIPLAFAPVLVFFLGALGLRLAYDRLVPRLGLPIPVGFLHAVLVTGVAVLFMDLGDDRHLFVDEVYEWSGSALLLLLALHAWRGWFFSSGPPSPPAPPRAARRDTRARVRLVLRLSLASLIIGGLAAVLALWGADIWALLADQDRFRAWIESYGIYAAPVFVAVQFVQVVVFVIPGEITQIAGGYIFGTLTGLVLSYVGLTLGSLVAFALGRLFEHAVLELLVERERLAKFDRLVYGRSGFWPMFILFLIPGIPKDLLCYVAGMTPMPLGTFLFINTVGRFPGVFLSSILGSGLAERDWMAVAVSAGVTAAVLLGVYAFRRPIERFRQRYLAPPGDAP
ncbi:MAG: TVP38/TMEM64 family protein [Candidatus Rokubacteria bacterium]|nr:TVP38/TMEM64 family protein [Candidatus Rokubacteria bacterium]